MINEMSYEEILAASKDMKNCCKVITDLIEDKEVPDLEDFVASVENYTKYLDNTIDLMASVDKALKDLVELKKTAKD